MTLINCTNQNFPHIKYDKNKDHYQWGLSHGEEFKQAIKELVSIRLELMLAKNPLLKNKIKELAYEQWDVSQNFSPYISKEIKGIADGSGLNIEDIIILNNYTDFRDIELKDEGCSTIYSKNETHNSSGQTWDMHSSAKKYVCVIETPQTKNQLAGVHFSLVGCVGMMGVNQQGLLVGVNNINTKNAKVGLIWPLLVRHLLNMSTLKDIKKSLIKSPVTSGHNYLISSPQMGEHWEVTPQIADCTSSLDEKSSGAIFHTNHCLSSKVKQLEDETSLSSTTHVRFDLLEKKVLSLNSHNDFIDLLKDHTNYPKSICSHYESGAQDPSMTCGGGVIDYMPNSDFKIHFWRGCQKYDDDYIEYNFTLNKDGIFNKN